MVAPARRYDVMACLRAAIIAHDNTCAAVAGKEISEDALACITKTKVNNNIRAQRRSAQSG
jgi:hypothetical protein